MPKVLGLIPSTEKKEREREREREREKENKNVKENLAVDWTVVVFWIYPRFWTWSKWIKIMICLLDRYLAFLSSGYLIYKIK
jgi:hypothetical protein